MPAKRKDSNGRPMRQTQHCQTPKPTTETDRVLRPRQNGRVQKLRPRNNSRNLQALEDIETLSQYEYEPLRGDHHIRTVTVHAIENRIECHLQQIEVSAGGYQALSYVWGSADKPYRAIVRNEDGKAVGYIPLTKTLWNALRDLRDAPELTSKVFWIDQLCINQTGDEKNHQVAMMGQIYKQAAKVITYTGPTEEDESLAEERAGFDLLTRLYEHFSPNHEMIMNISTDAMILCGRKPGLPITKMPTGMRLDNISSGYVAHGWRWLCRVCFGDWTRRLWMVQEQLLNREVVMMRGLRLLPWEMVAAATVLFGQRFLPRTIIHRFWREERSGANVLSNQIASSVRFLWRVRWNSRRIGATSTPYNSLLANLHLYDNLSCISPRDRIYALLAISSDAPELAIQPDYSSSDLAVFLDASVRMLEKSTNLDLLTLASRWGSSSDASHPSWAICEPPDQSRMPGYLSISKPHPQKSLPAPPSIRSNPYTLITKGRIIGRISMPASPIFPSASYYNGTIDIANLQSHIELLTCWTNVLRHSGSQPSPSLIAQLCRAITADEPNWEPTSHPSRQPIEQVVFHFWCLYRWQVLNLGTLATKLKYNAGKELRLFNAVISNIAELLNSSIDVRLAHRQDKLDSEELAATGHAFNAALIHDRTITLADDDLVCNATNEVKQGDVFAALRGAHRLYVLRPAGKQYRLVGDAYIYGLMQGEAYEGLDPDKVDYDIELI